MGDAFDQDPSAFPPQDQKCPWDLEKLQNKLDERSANVESTDDALDRHLEDEPNADELTDDDVVTVMQPRRVEGWLYRKESGIMGSHPWVRRFARLEGVDLMFFVQSTARQPKYTFTLDKWTTIAPGDANRVHKNKNVKFDLDLSNSNGESISVCPDTQAEAEEWMFTLSYIVRKLALGAGSA